MLCKDVIKHFVDINNTMRWLLLKYTPMLIEAGFINHPEVGTIKQHAMLNRFLVSMSRTSADKITTNISLHCWS